MKMEIVKRGSKVIKSCFRLIQMKWKNSRCLFFMDILIGFMREAKSMLNMVFPAVVIQYITDFTNMDMVLLLVFGFSLSLTIISLLMEMIQRSLSDYSLRSLNYLILRLNRSAMAMDLDKFEHGETIEKYDRAYDGIWNSSEVDFQLFSVILSKLISFGITFYIFQSIHWSVAILVVVTLLFEFVWNMKLDEKLYQKNIELSKLQHKVNYVSDTLLDYKTNKDIILNDAKEFLCGKFKDVTLKMLEITKRKKRDEFKADTQFALIELIRTGLIYIVAIFRYSNGLLPLANFTLFTNAAKQMTYAIWQIMQSIQQIFNASDYFEEYINYIELGTNTNHDGEKMSEEGIDTIQFVNVGYRYPNQNDYAVRNVSFTIHKGQTIGLVGDNGAGKSTIIKLLLRMYHVTEGDILLNGKSIYSYEYKDYLSYFSSVFQDYMLYAFSIRENILFDRKKEEEGIYYLLRNVGLEKRIENLPSGLDTSYTKKFDKDGVEFSGGEEQKLVIARALALGGEVLVLDEPTAAIDPLAEYDIYKLVLKLKESYTSLFISHRMSTTRFCDKILVFDEGYLMEEGTHQELMDKNGLYCKMYSMQKQYYDGMGIYE